MSVHADLVGRIKRLERATRTQLPWYLDEGEIAALEAQHAEAIAADVARERRELRARRIADVPVTTADAEAIAAETLGRTRARLAVEHSLAGDVPGLVLSGPPGRGKTVAAACGLAAVGGRYARGGDLARRFLAAFGDEVEEREEFIASRPLVVLDDVGCELRADLMSLALVELVDARRRGQRTIIVTNLSRSDFEERYPDPRLHSRLAQSAVWCVDAGPDLRRGRA